MARKSNAAQLDCYRNDLEKSRQWRQDEGFDALWDRMVDLYRGRQLDGMTEDDRVVVNLAFATKNVIAPSIAVNNPKFTVEAQRPEAAAQAIIVQEILNYVWRANKYKRQFRLAVDDFLIIGHGWLKAGYKFVKEPVTTGQTTEGYEADSLDAEGVDDRDETADGNVETEMRVVTDRPFVERISFNDIYVDPDCRNVDEMAWICQRVRRPVADVMVDKRYTGTCEGKLTRMQVSGTRQGRFEKEGRHKLVGVDGTDVPGKGGNGSYVDVFEFYDIKRNRMSVFAETAKGFLIPPKKVDYAFGHPFLMLRNYDVPDQFYPMGELEAMESLQHELNMTRMQMFNHRKRFARKWLIQPEAFDAAGLAALESDEDNTMVMMAPNSDPLKAVQPMPAVMTPPEFYNQSNQISQDIMTITATNEYQRGDMPDIRRTATEAAMIQDAANARSADKLARIEDFLAETGERIIQLMQQYMTSDQVIRIVGTSGMNSTWVNYDSSYIEGVFDFTVEGGSTQPRNESFRKQSANNLVQAMTPFVGAGVINVPEFAKYILNEFGVKMADQLVQTPPPPAPAGPEGGAPMGPEGMPPEGAPTLPQADPGSVSAPMPMAM